MIRVVAALLLIASPSPAFGFVPSSIASSKNPINHFPLVALRVQEDTNVDEKTDLADEYKKMAMEMSESNGSSTKEDDKITTEEPEIEAVSAEEIIQQYNTAAGTTDTKTVEEKGKEAKTEEEMVESMTVEPTSEQAETDEEFMGMAIDEALSGGGERGPDSAFPRPTTGAVLVAADGRVLGKGRSDYMRGSVENVIADTGLRATALAEWCIEWVSNPKLREDLASSTLYLTLEPSPRAKGEVLPPITKLIEQAGIPNVVIGMANPIPDFAYKGAIALHESGISVRVLEDTNPLNHECRDIIPTFSELSNTKLRRVARKQYSLFQRPLGYLHCSVVDSSNVEAFARHGNAFGKDFNGKVLNFRDFGSYEIAPPPEVVWAEDDLDDEDDDFDDSILSLDFEDEDFQGGIQGNPVTPWYEQADAVVVTFPRPGNGPADDDSLSARLNGLKWLATHGSKLPPGVERILVMDATDLEYVPLTNDDPKTPKGADVEALWAAEGRRPTRVLLRRGKSAEAKAAAEAAVQAAESAAQAAQAAQEAIETGDAAVAAEAALEYQKAAMEQTQMVLKQLEKAQQLKTKLTSRGVVVETIEGGEPVDVMRHLGRRTGLKTVVWRAGCWGGRGVKSILDGAFQWVSAHLAVDATGGRFWQKMVAENAVQGACGPERKVKIFADQEDISLEYCDEPDINSDCSFTMDGRPIRHVRLDCRVALVDQNRERVFRTPKTKGIDKKYIEEQAPWFL